MVPVVVLALLVALIATGVVCYHSSQASGFLDVVKKFRRVRFVVLDFC